MSENPYAPWPAHAYLPPLERLADTLTEALAAADPAADVPACPGWSVRHLAAHVTHVHRWARGAIVEGHPNTPERPAAHDAPSAAAGYRAAADALLDTLRTTDPATGCWTFGPRPRTVAFWFRRQPLEIAVHLVDVLASQGLDAVLDERLCLDGVDEVVTMFFPRQVRLGRIAPLQRSLAIVAEGTPYRWVLAGDGTVHAPDDGHVEASVTGPAMSLLLALWQRVPLDDPSLRVDGDEGAARSVLAAGITP